MTRVWFHNDRDTIALAGVEDGHPPDVGETVVVTEGVHEVAWGIVSRREWKIIKRTGASSRLVCDVFLSEKQ